MTIEEKDAAAVRVPPPLVFLAAVLLGVGLQALVHPLPLPLGRGLRIGLALASALAGLGLAAAAIGLFRRSGQEPEPWKPTPEIIATGVYRWTRNPMYVGMALLQTGIGLGLANGWVLAGVAVALAVVYATAVRHEEAYLERKFGDAYRAYKRSVRRWL